MCPKHFTGIVCFFVILCVLSLKNKKSAAKLKVPRKETYGSLDLGIRAPNSFILSFMLNLLRLSTTQSKTQIDSFKDTVNKQYTTEACVF